VLNILHVYLKLSTGASGEPTTVMSSGAMMSGSSIPLTSTQGVTGVLVAIDVGTLVSGVDTGVVTGVVTVVISSTIIKIRALYCRTTTYVYKILDTTEIKARHS